MALVYSIFLLHTLTTLFLSALSLHDALPILGVFDGKEVLRTEVHAKGPTAGSADMPADPHGQIFMGEPPGFVPRSAAAGQGSARAGAGEPQRHVKTYSDAEVEGARTEAERLADSNPDKMTEDQIKADKAE